MANNDLLSIPNGLRALASIQSGAEVQEVAATALFLGATAYSVYLVAKHAFSEIREEYRDCAILATVAFSVVLIVPFITSFNVDSTLLIRGELVKAYQLGLGLCFKTVIIGLLPLSIALFGIDLAARAQVVRNYLNR